MANSNLGNRRPVSAGYHAREFALAPSAEADWLIPNLLISALASLLLINVPGLLPALLLVTVAIVTKRYLIAGGQN